MTSSKIGEPFSRARVWLTNHKQEVVVQDWFLCGPWVAGENWRSMKIDPLNVMQRADDYKYILVPTHDPRGVVPAYETPEFDSAEEAILYARLHNMAHGFVK